MTIANSTRARDIAYYVHPQTNLQVHEQNGPMIISHGEGIYIYDDDNRKYIDGAAGLWCASLGFSSERLAKVAYDQMRKLGFYHSYRSHSHETAIDLTEKLIQIAPVPMSKVLLQCSGSEANDTAIKLLWYYHHAIGKPEKCKIIGRMGGYHGSTAASISASGKPEMHADFGLPFPQFRHTEMPHYYRRRLEGESEEEFSTRMADALESMILEEGPDTVAAFFAEPVMGAGGAIVPPKGYFEKIQTVLKKYDVLFVADEVVCGFGRTGNMWGSQTFDLKPDMISCAKALSAAMQPISALLINERVYKVMLAQSGKLGSFAHGYTYTGHPVAAAVALEVLKIYEEIDIVGHVKRVGAHLQTELAKFADHPLVGDARGVGLIAGLDLVSDKKTREPLKGIADIEKCAKANGVILRFIGNRVALSPPLIITEDQVDEMLARLKKTLDEVYAGSRLL
jgi:4-aminobutyrate--pyruvate transaminase